MKILNPWLIRLHGDDNAAIRLFCFHFAGGSALAFRPWTKYLPDDVELLAIQLPGRDARYSEPVITEMADVITALLPALRPYLDKPYLVYGHSLGALMAYETIRALDGLNSAPPELFLASAHRAPHLAARRKPIYTLTDREFIAKIGGFDGTDKVVLENEELMSAFLPRIRADFQILDTYEYRSCETLNTPILAMMGRDDIHVNESELLAWAEHSGKGFRCHFFAGGHFFIKQSEKELLDVINHECAMLAADLFT